MASDRKCRRLLSFFLLRTTHAVDGVHTQPANARRRWWKYCGLGLPKSWAEIRFRDIAVVLLVGLTIFGYVDVTKRGRVVPGFIEAYRTDFTVYTEAGAAFFDGRDPYRVTNPRGWFYLYPPVLALAVSPLSVLDPVSQVGAWYALSVLAAFGCFGEARRLWRSLSCRDGFDRAQPLGTMGTSLLVWIVGCAALAMLFPTLDCFQRGQVGVLLIYLLMLGYRLARHGMRWPAWLFGGFVLALPVAIKLIPLLPVGFLLCQLWCAPGGPGSERRGRARALAVTGGTVLGGLFFLVVFPSLCVGWTKNVHHLQTWYQRVVLNPKVNRTAGFNIYSLANQSLSNATHLIALKVTGTTFENVSAARGAELVEQRYPVAEAGVWVVQLSLLVALLLAATLSARTTAVDQAAAFGLSCSAVLVLSPVSWGHYFMLQLPALIAVPLWLAKAKRPTAAVAAGLPMLLCLAHYFAKKWVGPIGLLGFGTALWVVVATCLLVASSVGASSDPAVATSRPERAKRSGISNQAKIPATRYN